MADATFSLPVGLPADPALLPTLLDLLPLGVIYYTPVIDADGTLTDLALAYLNPAAQRITRLPARPATTYRQQFPATDANGAWDFHRQSWANQQSQHFQFYDDADGFDGHFRVTAQRVGEGLLAVFTDTRDDTRRQVAQVLHEQRATGDAAPTAFHVATQVQGRQHRETERQQLHYLFMEAPVGVAILTGPELVYEFVNPNYQGLLLGRALLGRPVFEALPELIGTPLGAMLREVYATGQTQQVQNLPVPVAHAADGMMETRHFTFMHQARRDDQQRITGVLLFVFEVTESVLARQQVQSLNEELATINEELTATNEELHESNAQLTRTNVDLDTFVYTASHDLKAPISNIESILLTLRDTLPAEVQQDEMIAHLLDLLEQTTTRFQVTIGQLTDLSKLQLAHAGPAEPVRLAAVVNAVRLDLAPAIMEADAQLTVEIAPDLLVSFSPGNLRSAVYNLLSNAVKYRDPARLAQVRIRAFPAKGQVVLEVQDNGLGLNAHQQSRLFGLFQRLHTHVEGTGVGLYTVKRLVENGGGTIAVESQVDVGTTFTLTFPT